MPTTKRPDPARKAALRRLKTNKLLLEALQVEPALLPILEAARDQQNTPGYHRIRTYYDLKAQAEYLVGWSARKPEINTMEHYSMVMSTIGDLLVEDDVDIYPNGNPDAPERRDPSEQAQPVAPERPFEIFNFRDIMQMPRPRAATSEGYYHTDHCTFCGGLGPKARPFTCPKCYWKAEKLAVAEGWKQTMGKGSGVENKQ